MAPISRGLILLLSIAVGLIAANLYYAQPLVALIGNALGIQPAAAGIVVTLTQIGYGFGVFFIVPLGDLVENRKLILTMLCLAIVAALGLAFVNQLVPYFIIAALMGLGASTLQIIVPFAAHLSPEATRGRVVGTLMSGLMLGIMLSRPAAGFLSDLFSWHAVFLLSAVLMAVLAVALFFFLPTRQPTPLGIGYQQLLLSMGQLFLHQSILRRRALYQACIFGAFCLFWTASPLYLAGPEFHLSQTAIAIFALVGISGTVAAPFAGRWADAGLIRPATIVALSLGSGSFLLSKIFDAGSTTSLVFLGLTAILLDAGVSANLVLGQRAIFSLSVEQRSRLNGLYIATIFVGGSAGSALGAWAYSQGGWGLTSWIGFLMPVLALAYFFTE